MATHWVDWMVIVVAVLVNLLLLGMFLGRAFRRQRLARVTGTAVVCAGLPLAVAVILNAAGGHPWWTYVLPLPMVVYCLVELWLDYVVKSRFRETRWLGPYLLLYYLGLMGLIGYAFLANKAGGFATLVTYFLGLGATGYSYRRVGHGV